MKWTNALIISLMTATPLAAQDAANGEKIFKKCSACHEVGADAKNKVGPMLTGVVGRAAGSVEGYKYGKSMLQAAENGLVWTPGLLAEYITDPKKFLRSYLDDSKAKAKMTFKLKKPEDRADVIAYLATFSPAAEGTDDQANLCIENKAQDSFFFVAEASDGQRVSQQLAVGETLCIAGGEQGARGVVSVFPDQNHLEGCSRLTPMGNTETLKQYADFDRCEWGSHAG